MNQAARSMAIQTIQRRPENLEKLDNDPFVNMPMVEPTDRRRMATQPHEGVAGVVAPVLVGRMLR
jgi:hypothetical protein